MKLSDYAPYIGKIARLHYHPVMPFDVKILDVKQSYGNIRFLVEPVSGSGQAWVQDNNLKVDV